MKPIWLGLAAVAVVSACGGGNPWLDDDEPPATTIPKELLGDLESFDYDPVAQTLIVRGISLDNTPFATTYTRKPGLDVPGYEGYSTQSGSLDRHSTAYVREINGTRAAIVVTGGQFRHYFGGSHYSRSGAYSPPTVGPNSGIVTYAGNYVGLLNMAGDGGDLLAVNPGTPNDVRPVQAAEVTGKVLINADFADNIVNGVVYGRVIPSNTSIDLSQQSIDLAPTSIEADGTFTGDAERSLVPVGTYGGLFGGKDATEVAGTLFVTDHITGLNQIEEYGLFVLSQCGTANADPICNQPNP